MGGHASVTASSTATIGSTLSLEGYSTHLNVALPTKFGDRVARIYTHRSRLR